MITAICLRAKRAKEKQISRLQILLHDLTSPLIFILLVATVVTPLQMESGRVRA